MAISDKALFGLTVAQAMAEDASEAARMCGSRGKYAVRTEAEAVEYTAEILSLLGAQCAICGALFISAPDELLCPACEAWEREKEKEHQEEVAEHHAATNGTL